MPCNLTVIGNWGGFINPPGTSRSFSWGGGWNYSWVGSTPNNSNIAYTVKLSSTDRPWVTLYFKSLIAKRGRAFAQGNLALFRNLRNRVSRVRKSLQRQFFLDRVETLKSDNPSCWWKNMKCICQFARRKTD